MESHPLSSELQHPQEDTPIIIHVIDSILISTLNYINLSWQLMRCYGCMLEVQAVSAAAFICLWEEEEAQGQE